MKISQTETWQQRWSRCDDTLCSAKQVCSLRIIFFFFLWTSFPRNLLYDLRCKCSLPWQVRDTNITAHFKSLMSNTPPSLSLSSPSLPLLFCLSSSQAKVLWLSIVWIHKLLQNKKTKRVFLFLKPCQTLWKVRNSLFSGGFVNIQAHLKAESVAFLWQIDALEGDTFGKPSPPTPKCLVQLN